MKELAFDGGAWQFSCFFRIESTSKEWKFATKVANELLIHDTLESENEASLWPMMAHVLQPTLGR